MKRLPAELLLAIRDSFWAVPGGMLVTAVLLAVGLVELDARVQLDLAAEWPRLFGAGAEGARGMLAAIAGSMITVAGVVFSVTIVALSLAANAYSPRVLRTFMRDRPTQAVFGLFVGTFAYCIVVLRTVRSAAADQAEFVPALALLGAIVLALAGVLLLVYFIHHVAISIQLPTIVERVADETRRAIDRLFPQRLGSGEMDPETAGAAEGRAWRALPARRSGYIVAVDADGLLAFARERQAVVRMDRAVGEFAIEAQPLASITRCDDSIDRDADALDALYSIAGERTVEQDPAFGMQQIIDIATRALSPAVNNPSAATLCIDHLSALLARMAPRRMPDPRRSEAGALRVIARGATFESLVELMFGTLAEYANGKADVLASLERAARAVENAAPESRRGVVREHMQAIKLARR